MLTLALAELVLRFAGPRLVGEQLPLDYDLQAIDLLAAGQAYVMFDPDLGWVTTPSIEWRRDDEIYRNNRAGQRADREYSPRPPAAVVRFSAYGDSFTYCEEVKFEECWTSLLETQLTEHEVLNFGVPGYGPDQAYLRYLRNRDTWAQCAVLIGVTVENINRVVNRFRPFYSPTTGVPLAKPRFVLEGAQLRLIPNPARRPDDLRDPRWVEAELGPLDDWYFPGTFVANPLDSLELISVARTAAYQFDRQETVRWTAGRAAMMYREDSEPLAVLVAVLEAFAAQVRADGSTPVVGIFPWAREVIAYRDSGVKFHGSLVDKLAALGVPVVDLTEAFAREARTTDLSRLMGNHLSSRGTMVVARTLADELPGLTASTCGGH